MSSYHRFCIWMQETGDPWRPGDTHLGVCIHDNVPNCPAAVALLLQAGYRPGMSAYQVVALLARGVDRRLDTPPGIRVDPRYNDISDAIYGWVWYAGSHCAVGRSAAVPSLFPTPELAREEAWAWFEQRLTARLNRADGTTPAQLLFAAGERGFVGEGDPGAASKVVGSGLRERAVTQFTAASTTSTTSPSVRRGLSDEGASPNDVSRA